MLALTRHQTSGFRPGVGPGVAVTSMQKWHSVSWLSLDRLYALLATSESIGQLMPEIDGIQGYEIHNY